MGFFKNAFGDNRVLTAKDPEVQAMLTYMEKSIVPTLTNTRKEKENGMCWSAAAKNTLTSCFTMVSSKAAAYMCPAEVLRSIPKRRLTKAFCGCMIFLKSRKTTERPTRHGSKKEWGGLRTSKKW